MERSVVSSAQPRQPGVNTSAVATASEYEARAVDRIRDILATEHAVVRRELESRISEGYWPRSGQNIDPHHVSNAARSMVNDGEVEWVYTTTRGGANIATLQPTNRSGRADRIDRAAARKRLLWGRYLGWATGTKRHPHGLIGPAGEAATRSAIVASGAVIPHESGAGSVSQIMGVQLPGPLDSAGITVPISAAGVPGAPVTLLFEVKNLRQWLYPSAAEPFQLLGKAVAVQLAHPQVPIVPVLVCRKAHPTLFWMAKQLGFMVIDMGKQFIGTAVDEASYMEVYTELDFDDLLLGEGPSLRVKDRLANTLRKDCPLFADVWQASATHPKIGTMLLKLSRLKAADQQVRTGLVEAIRAIVVDSGGDGW